MNRPLIRAALQIFLLYVERQDFSSVAGMGDFSSDSKSSGVLPDLGHESLISRSLRQRLLQA
jgi:hypothetical protein